MLKAKQKKTLIRLCISAILYIIALLTKEPLKDIFFIISYIVIGYDVIYKAFRNIGHGQIFDEYFLMGIATIGAALLSDFGEAAAVMLLYQLGEWFQSYASERSRQSIASLMDIRPDYAVIEKDGTFIKVDPEEVEIGTLITIRPGERVPLDGIVIDGESFLDTSALTGESQPRLVKNGEEVISGCINKTGVIKVQVNKEFEESTVSKILDLVENSSSKKSKSENFISKFAHYYTPIVVFSALALALIPPLFIGIKDPLIWKSWIYRGLNFLVVSCPCALVLSVPLSFFSGLGSASKAGVLIKGSNYLEALAEVKTIAFDKTGTLTSGSFKVIGVDCYGNLNESEILSLAARCEKYSNHPISESIKEAAVIKEENDCTGIEEIAGHGVKALIDNQEVLVGNSKLLLANGVEIIDDYKTIGTLVYVAIDKKLIGRIIIGDEIKSDIKEDLAKLKKEGIVKTVLLTGDNKDVANKVAEEIGINEVYAELLPQDKVNIIEKLLKENQGKVAFTGDGINDAPVLMRSDVGIAMGALGSDAAIEAADIVLMDDDISKIVTAIHISRKTLKIVKENIIFAIAIKIFVLILSAIGHANMWAAIFADVGVAIICVLNAMRALNINK